MNTNSQFALGYLRLARTVATLITITSAATLLASCSGDAQAKQAAANVAPPVSVAVAPVSAGGASAPITATGTFASRDEIPLSFKIGGIVARVLVDQGASVHKGQLLATLDLREIDALVEKAKIAADKAERDAARIRRLAADSVATASQLQDATSVHDAARADYAQAKVNREFATIVAPEDGLVLQRSATAGITINAGSTVLTLAGRARGRVLRVGIPDRDALRVHVGDAVTARFDAAPGVVFRGTVSLRSGATDVRTGTIAVEISLRDAASLPDGVMGRAEIAVHDGGHSAMIPVDALLEAHGDSATVYSVSATQPYTAQPHRVRIIQLLGDMVAVNGLENGTRVITRGAPYVTAGAQVRIAEIVP